MRVFYRNLTIELAPDDPRVAQIHQLLFGSPPPLLLPPPPVLDRVVAPPVPVEEPPPEPVPAPPDPPVIAESAPEEVPAPPPGGPPPPPPVVVSEALLLFWNRIDDSARKELSMLALGRMRPAAIEQELGLSQRKLMGQHSVIGRHAARCRAGRIIVLIGIGQSRPRRWFALREGLAPSIVALAAGTAVAGLTT